MRRRVMVGLGLTAALLLVGSARGASQERLPTNPVAGAQIFIEKGCVLCHAIRGEGGSIGPDLGRVELNHSLLEVAGIMWSHSPRMNEKLRELRAIRPILTPQEMGDLIAFLYFLNYFGQTGDPKVGEDLFAKKGCQRCHRVGGAGGRVGPPLDSYKQYVSPIFIARALWNHGPEMKAAMKRHGVKRPEFAGNDLSHILAYIQTASTALVERRYVAPGNPQRGREVFKAKGCLGCHAIRGRGGRVGPDLGQIDRLRGSLTQIAGTMWNHGPKMWDAMRQRKITPPELTVEEMNDLVTYLYFLQYMDEPGDTKVGRALFSEKGCVQCHSLRAREEGKIFLGGREIRAALASPIAVVTAMWNHASQMEMVAEARRIVWPRFEGHEMADIVAYVLSGVGQPQGGP
ncbi:MAG: c-type cytochrome [Nitrospinota bacterium]